MDDVRAQDALRVTTSRVFLPLPNPNKVEPPMVAIPTAMCIDCIKQLHLGRLPKAQCPNDGENMVEEHRFADGVDFLAYKIQAQARNVYEEIVDQGINDRVTAPDAAAPYRLRQLRAYLDKAIFQDALARFGKVYLTVSRKEPGIRYVRFAHITVKLRVNIPQAPQRK